MKIIFLIFIIFPLIVRASNISEPLKPPPIPSIETSVNGFTNNTLKKGSGKFTVVVAVPEDHHVYIDKGKNGYYIPVSFDFSKLSSAGYKITQNKSPVGQYDEVVEALVLRGKGEFSFLLKKKKKLPTKKNISFSITYQICDDVIGICYPSQNINIKP